MSVNSAIRTALDDYVKDGWLVQPDLIDVNKDHYITFNVYYDGGDNFGDDAPEHNVVSVYVHMYLPMQENYLAHKRRIRQLLFEYGFTYAEITEMDDPDREGYRHVIFDVMYVEESEV